MALHAGYLKEMNENIVFVSVATWEEAKTHLEEAQKIIICGRVGEERDPTLYAWLSNAANVETKQVYGSPAYNFGNFPINVSRNREFNLLPTSLVVPGMIPYKSDLINRRVKRAHLDNLITIGQTGRPNKEIIDSMMKYGFMKNICLPSSPGTIGFLVKAGARLGNSAYGIALYKQLDVESGRPPAVLIQEHIAEKGDTKRGRENRWVNEKLSIPGIQGFIDGTKIDNEDQDIQDMFFEALALAIDLFIEYAKVPYGQAIRLLENGFPTLSTDIEFDLPPVPTSSPMWDLFLVTCSLRDIPPAELETGVLAGTPNSFPTSELLQLSGLEPISVGGKTRRRKRTKRTKHKRPKRTRRRL